MELIDFIFILLIIIPFLPAIGQVYYSNRRVKGKLKIPLYLINIFFGSLAIVFGIFATYLAIELLQYQAKQSHQKNGCISGVATFLGLGIFSAFFIQPFISLFFFIDRQKINN